MSRQARQVSDRKEEHQRHPVRATEKQIAKKSKEKPFLFLIKVKRHKHTLDLLGSNFRLAIFTNYTINLSHIPH